MSHAQREKIGNIKTRVKEYADLLKASGFPVLKVFLYGSYAKGNFKNGSDIDVCIVSKAYDPYDDKSRLFLWQKRREINVRIKPVGYRPEEFQDSNPLVHEIRKYGIRIV